jgi:hypothetical protein
MSIKSEFLSSHRTKVQQVLAPTITWKWAKSELPLFFGIPKVFSGASPSSDFSQIAAVPTMPPRIDTRNIRHSTIVLAPDVTCRFLSAQFSKYSTRASLHLCRFLLSPDRRSRTHHSRDGESRKVELRVKGAAHPDRDVENCDDPFVAVEDRCQLRDGIGQAEATVHGFSQRRAHHHIRDAVPAVDG